MTGRLVRLQLILSLALGLLVVRLVHLQLVRGAHYRRLAEQNRLRLVPEPAPRGLILDRRGRLLASNQTVFRVAIVPQELEDFPGVLRHIGALTHRSPDALNREYRRERSLAFMPATVVSYVPKEVAIRLEETRWQFPGLFVKPETVRHYPGGSSAAQLLGYLSQPTAEELPALKSYGVRPQHLVGRSGLERLLDEELRGRSGGLMVEVDHRARQVRVIGRRTPEAGSKVTLTLDAQLQSLIEQAFGTQAGGCVVLDPETGEVLAMVSVPAFQPEAFIDPETPVIRSLLDDPRSPLMNRTTVGVYLPGSILKLVAASAALEAGVITPSTTIVCPGSLTIGDRVFHCWNLDGHGPMTLRDALMQSCNVYFMQIGRRLGLKRLRAALEAVGLSRRTGWPLEEQRGHLPDRPLTEGEVAMLAMGQGEVLVTVLQAAVMAAAFANHGWAVEPWVVREIAHRPPPRRPSRRPIPWSPETFEAVRAGMEAVVRDPDGTGHRAFSPLVSAAGKTGTAQTHVPGRTHGWFVGFCPVDHPRAAIAVLAEYGGSGGDLPAEIARTICEYVTAPEAL
ncbi:MAG: penicillin-binding protein 2 [Candidatus Omnitrophica bacterium]|nr:penicillin-binding protein 2 [Candidatus Omnitrophota bacterium]